MNPLFRSTRAERVSHVEVLRLAWPVMVSMISYTSLAVVDAIFVGWLGTTELAAVGLATVAVHLVLSLPHGILQGTRTVTSIRTGAGRATADLAWQVAWLALALGVVVASLAPLATPLFAAMGATAEVTAEAGRYFVPRALGAPLFLLQSGLTAWFQGRGDTRTPMKATLVANVINVVLDPILIFGLGPIPATGIAGASWATVVGYGGSALVLARRALVLGGGARAVDRAALSAILRVGLPVGTHFVLDVAAWAVFASVLARVGEVDLAAHVLVIRIVMVSFLPGHAVGEATGVIVGQALGAGRPARARGAWLAGTRIAVALMAACGAVFTIAPGLLVGVFGPAPEVAELARRLLLVAAGFQVFDAIATVGLLTLTGAGDTRFTMVVSVLVAWAVKLPAGVGLALGAGMGVIGAWLGLTLEIFVVALLVTVRLLGGAWVAAPRETFDQSPSEPLPA